MIRLKGSNTAALAVKARSASDFANSRLVQDPTTTFVGGEFGERLTLADGIYDRWNSATFYEEGVIVDNSRIPSVSIKNLDPDVATITESGAITRVSEGMCRVVFRGLVDRMITLNLFTRSAESALDTYVSHAPGCLAKSLSDEVDDRINGTMTMAANGGVFSTQDHSTPLYVRNPSLWCSDVDLTCISPWNSRGGQTRAGTLITPRHVAFIEHYNYHPITGDTVRFVDNEGNVYDRTIEAIIPHPDFNLALLINDINVAVLNADLPAAITPTKVMPEDYRDYLVHNLDNRPAAFGLDQFERATIIDYYVGGYFIAPKDADRLLFYAKKIGGDSGNPGFLIPGGELALVTMWSTGGAGGGTPVADKINDMNAMIVTANTQAGISGVDDPTWPNANGHYQLKPADFSGFPTY